MTANIPGLPGWKVLATNIEDGEYRIRARYEVHSETCPLCRSNRLTRNGTRRSSIRDIPFQDKHVIIDVLRQRYNCGNCGRWSTQYIPDITENRSETVRLTEYIQEQSLRRTFASVSAEVGVDENTVRNIFEEIGGETGSAFVPETPCWLGISEVMIGDRSRCLITNIQRNTLVDILEGTNKPVVKRWLQTQRSENIESVAISPLESHKALIADLLPNTPVLIDKRYYLREADKAFDSVLRSVRKGLSVKLRKKLDQDRSALLELDPNPDEDMRSEIAFWHEVRPVLSEARKCRKSFYGMFDNIASSETRSERHYIAWSRYLDWIKLTITPDISLFFKKLTQFMVDWFRPYLAYFQYDPRTLDAHFDSLARLIDQINSHENEYSFENLRAAILSNGTSNESLSVPDDGNRVAGSPMRSVKAVAYYSASAESYRNWEVDIQDLTDRYRNRESKSVTECAKDGERF